MKLKHYFGENMRQLKTAIVAAAFTFSGCVPANNTSQVPSTPPATASVAAMDAYHCPATPGTSMPSIDVRGSKMGSSITAVKKAEKGKPAAELPSGRITVLGYHETLAGQDAKLLYQFLDGKLFEVMYSMDRLKSCTSAGVTYDTLLTQLTAKYGTPGNSNQFAEGCMRYACWDPSGTGATVIHLMMNADHYPRAITLKYLDSAKTKESDEVKDKETKGKL